MNKFKSGKIFYLILALILGSSLHFNNKLSSELEYTLKELTLKQQQVINLTNEIQNYEEEIENIKLEHTNSLKELSIYEMFQIGARVYDIDVNLVYAIAVLETGNFTSNLFINNNNPGGISKGNGWASYSTRFEGIMEMCRLLRYNYINYGLTTPEAIGSKYCPNPEEGWAAKVNQLMSQNK